jgi:NADH dehydrogenase [ubiquinone] 1 alpha subcomplex assembly factor 3
VHSLAPLLLFKVRPELLVLGCGDRIRRPSAQLTQARVLHRKSFSVLRRLSWTQLLRDHGVSLECIDTPNAAATFNVLAQEGRRVAGAFIPPAYVAPEPPSGAPRGRSLPKSSTTGPFPNWRDREATV